VLRERHGVGRDAALAEAEDHTLRLGTRVDIGPDLERGPQPLSGHFGIALLEVPEMCVVLAHVMGEVTAAADEDLRRA
jgi:hypothetical protein